MSKRQPASQPPAGKGPRRPPTVARSTRSGQPGRPRQPARPARRPGAAAARAALAVMALALAAVPIVRQRALAARQEQMSAWLVRGGVLAPRQLEHEPDPGRVDLRAARASLGAELEPARHTDLSPAVEARQRAEGAARLAETASLASGVLAERPAAWDAAMVMGAATYLSWSLSRDPRLFTAAPAWELPLDTAIDLAPGRDEAARLLAGAYLELWPALSPAKRARERQLLARVFADPAAFAGLIGHWLGTAASRQEAFEVVPRTPEAWAQMQQIYAQQGDWDGFCAARERWDLALQASLAQRLAAAEERRASSDSRAQFLEVATEARTGRRYLDLLTRALEGCPPGSVDRRTAERLQKHLVWSLERCRLDRCPLSPRALRRLAGFCRDLDPRIDAMAALVTGDLPRAEVLERTYATAWTDDWAAYRLLKAKLLAERADRDERDERADRAARGAGGTAVADPVKGQLVEAALAEIPQSWTQAPSYWQVRAAAARLAGDPARETAAGRELSRLAAREWPATAWTFQGGLPRLELLAAAGASGLELAIDLAPTRGAAAEVRLDDAILGTFAVSPGTILALHAPLAPGLHLLEVETVAGGAVLPGTVRLARPDAGGTGAGTAAAGISAGGGGGSGAEPR
jgi:hypothetical protein